MKLLVFTSFLLSLLAIILVLTRNTLPKYSEPRKPHAEIDYIEEKDGTLIAYPIWKLK